jgi:hypothetical protein
MDLFYKNSKAYLIAAFLEDNNTSIKILNYGTFCCKQFDCFIGSHGVLLRSILTQIMSNHLQDWKLIPKRLPDNLLEATQQLHYAAQFLAATGQSFLTHQTDDGHTNLAWLQELGLQGRPFQLDQEYRLILNYERFQLELHNSSGLAELIINLDQKKQSDVFEELKNNFSKRANQEEGVFQPIQHYEIPDHSIKEGVPFQKPSLDALLSLRSFRDNAKSILTAVKQRFSDASEMRIWPHHFDNGSICVLEKNASGAMTKTVGWGFSIPNDTDSDHHFYVNHWAKNKVLDDPMLPDLPEGAYWSKEPKLMAILPIRALQAMDTIDQQRSLAAAYFTEGIKASSALIQA